MMLRGQQAGYAMVALLMAMSVMAIMMTVALPTWKQLAQREKEAELVFRGEQYARAIGLFQAKAGPGTLPPTIDLLVEQRFLRKKFKDPITNDDFAPLSRSPAPPRRDRSPARPRRAGGRALRRSRPAPARSAARRARNPERRRAGRHPAASWGSRARARNNRSASTRAVITTTSGNSRRSPGSARLARPVSQDSPAAAAPSPEFRARAIPIR